MTYSQLLIIGPACPSRTVAAGISTQIALFFRSQLKVTLVMSDYAPPATGFPSDIDVIRERDLRRKVSAYSSAGRLYILDDSYESLFALRLLTEAPAPWINADTTLHKLLHEHHKADSAYPSAYFDYLEQSLSIPGRHIAHSLTGGTRVSKSIASEIRSFDALAELAPHIELSNKRLSLTLAPEQPLGSKGGSDCFEVVTIGEASAHSAVETINSFGRDIEHRCLTGSEPDLADRINNAGVICLLDKAHRLPPAALTLALDAGKAIITASQPWVRHLPTNTRLNIPHSEAVHHLVAALASLLGKSTVGHWLKDGTQQFLGALNTPANHATLTKKILTAKIPPLALRVPEGTTVSDVSSLSNETQTEDATGPIISDEVRPYALIGAVPAQALVTQLFPSIDWKKSPRFATPELAKALCKATGKTAPVMLALLGYESLLIESDASSDSDCKPDHMPATYSWPQIQAKLKEVKHAITFDCTIEGLPKARSLTPRDTVVPGGLTINFSPDIHEDVLRQPVSGFLEESGTYWQLNQIEHRIDCLLISGVPGGYKLSLNPTDSPTVTEDVAFMVTDSQASHLMTNTDPAVVRTDSQGIIQFTLSAAHPVNHYPLTFEQLLKTLASTPLYLEWCSHG